MSKDNESSYYSISNAYSELVDSHGTKETAISGAKLLGKGLFNVAKFAIVECLPFMVEHTAKQNLSNSEKLLKRDDLSDEQREQYKEVRDKSKDFLERLEDRRKS